MPQIHPSEPFPTPTPHNHKHKHTKTQQTGGRSSRGLKNPFHRCQPRTLQKKFFSCPGSPNNNTSTNSPPHQHHIHYRCHHNTNSFTTPTKQTWSTQNPPKTKPSNQLSTNLSQTPQPTHSISQPHTNQLQPNNTRNQTSVTQPHPSRPSNSPLNQCRL